MDGTAARSQGTLSSVSLSYAALITIAVVVNFAFGSKSLTKILADGRPIAEQLLLGFALTLAIGIPTWSFVLGVAPLSSFRRTLVRLLGRIDTAGLNPLWIALLAGVGEETLFRGALQPIIGIWWASIIFALLHFGSYQLRSINLQKIILVLLAFGGSVLLGILFKTVGLVAAVVVHAGWDLLGILAIRRAAATPDASG